MLKESKRWMNYTWFNRKPASGLFVAHLFSAVHADLPWMVRVPYPTLVVNLQSAEFVSSWSSSTRTKINKAIREERTVDRGHYLIPDILRLFLTTTVARRGLSGYKPEDLNQFPDIEASAVHLDGVMLCGHIWIVDKEEKRAILFVNATNEHADKTGSSLIGRAHYFLLWQDGLFLRDQGIATMDLMGYDPETTDPALTGVNQWKEGTHGQRQMLYHYYPFWFYTLRKLWLRFRR